MILRGGGQFADFVEEWDESIKIGNEIVAAANLSCNDVINHIAGQERERQRKEKADAAKKQPAQLEAIREQAKRQAEDIRARNKPVSEKALGPVFLVSFDDLEGVRSVPRAISSMGKSLKA